MADTTYNNNYATQSDDFEEVPAGRRAAAQSYNERVAKVKAEMEEENPEKGAIANAKSQVSEKVEEAKELVKDQVKQQVKNKAKQLALQLALENPVVLGVIAIIIIVVIILVVFVVLNNKAQDTVGTSFTNICNAVGQDNCLKTVLNQSGVGLLNSSK